jgi:hypothetical protein
MVKHLEFKPLINRFVQGISPFFGIHGTVSAEKLGDFVKVAGLLHLALAIPSFVPTVVEARRCFNLVTTGH